MGWGLALKGVTALGGAAMAGDVYQGLSQWGGKRTREINNMSDQEFADYNPSLFDQYVLGQGSREQASGRRDDFITEDAKTGSGKAQYLQYAELVPDLKVEAGDDITDIASRNSGAIKKARTQGKLDDAKLVADAQWNSKGEQHERFLAAQARTDAQLQAAQLRADNNQIRLDGLDAERRRERKEDRRYNESIERMNTQDRRAAMSSLGAGLAALGAAFAL